MTSLARNKLTQTSTQTINLLNDNRQSDISNTHWHTHLSDSTDLATLVTFNNNVYVGTHGYVYKIDAQSGELLATNSLKKTHNHNILLAISEDGKYLFVGTDGYAICIDTDRFETECWREEVSSSNSDVSVLFKHDTLYAACNGYAYQLDASTGNKLATNSLHKTHHNNILMTISVDGKFIYFGTDGYVICVNTDNFEQEYWRNEVNPKSSDVVSLLLYGDTLYAACHNNAYKLDASTGEPQDSISFSNTHSCPLSLAITSEGEQLFVGVSGQVICIETNAFGSELWRTELFDSKANVSLLIKDKLLNTGCKGYLQQLDISTGKLVFVNSLVGIGGHDISLATDDSQNNLYVASGGNVVGMDAIQLLSAGWDMVFAYSQQQINQQIQKRYDNNQLPHNLADLTIGCPSIVASSSKIQNKLTLSLPLGGAVKSVFKVDGFANCTVDLNQINTVIHHKTGDEYSLNIEFSDAVFESIDLSNLKVTFINQDIALEKQQKLLLTGLNEAFAQCSPINLTFTLNMPIAVDNAVIKLAFVNNTTADNSFLALLVGSDTTVALTPLATTMIANNADCDATFVFSNQLIMNYLAKYLTQIITEQGLFDDDNFLQLQPDTYPELLSNNVASSNQEFDCGASVKINKNGIQSQFMSDGRLGINLTLSYTEIIVKVRHSYPINLYISFCHLDGKLQLDFDNKIGSCSGGTTCHYIKKAVKEALADFEQLFANGLQVTLPNLNVKQVQSPSFVQISGKLLN